MGGKRHRAGGAALLVVSVLASRIDAQTAEEYHARADAALQSFLDKFWSQSSDYLRHQFPGSGSTGYWTFAQGFDALLDGVERTGGAQYTGLVDTFYEAQERRGWIVSHYDDENWMALALIRAYDLLGEERFLETAIFLYDDIRGGWDTSCCGSRRGGIWWDKAQTQKATAANAGPVITGVRLWERTGDESYLQFARQVYDFWLLDMVHPVTFQVTDHIEPNGSKVFWRFTYNEGLMLGAALELYQATGEEDFLTTAENIAGFMTSNEVVPSRFGGVLSDGSNTSCGGDCHAFKGIAYRYLMRLYEETGRAEYENVLRGSAEAIWNLARTPADELFAVSWTGPLMTSYSEPQTVAAVMALNLYAMHAGPYPGSGIPPDRYEAENATIRGVGLEAEHEGFTGWGYVAGWSGNGQRVDFDVETEAEGAHRLALRYAAGAGDATRLVRVDGVVVVADMAFPATDSWADYAVVETAIELTAGVHRISIAFEAGRGSQNFLNLDHLSVRSLATPYFLRGDANADGLIEVSDALKVLLHAFLAAPIECTGTADVDDSGEVEVTDAIWLLNYLVLEGAPPPPPFPQCGNDPTLDELTCDGFVPCF